MTGADLGRIGLAGRLVSPWETASVLLAAMSGRTGFALLSQRWRTLQHITSSPSKIGVITRATLVLLLFEHGYIT